MADIFISYSQQDRDNVVMLAAYLESEGWTVWWDTNLMVGDAYRDEIMKQLAAARAVIVLWTQNSIKSDFVRAEAGRAKADGKLIPVKESDVAYGDIPLPFGEMHTEDLSKRELIRAAVVAQQAKPAVQPSALWLASKTVRYHLLGWFGVIGGTITLFSSARALLTLADWAHVLVENWQEWSHRFWSACFSWLSIELPRELTPVLSFVAFGIALAINTRWRPETPTRAGVVTKGVYVIFLKMLAFMLAGAMLSYIIHPFLWVFSIQSISDHLVLFYVVSTVGYLLGLFIMASYDKSGREGLWMALLMYPSFILIVVLPLQAEMALGLEAAARVEPLTYAAALLYLLFIAALPVMSSVKLVNSKLLHSLIGLVALVCLNELSKHGAYLRELLN